MIQRNVGFVVLLFLALVLTGCGQQTGTTTISTPGSTPSTNTTLSSISLSSGTLSPSFSTSVASYTATVSNSVSSITVTPTGSGTIKVDGTTVNSGSASGAISLSVGSNTITIKAYPSGSVTAETYIVNVIRSNSGSTYYISTTGSDSTGDGSQAKPWATPGHGSRQLSAGDTLIILGGTYTLTRYDQDIITPQNSGTASAPIIIRGEIGNRPVLAAKNTSASGSGLGLLAMIDLNGKSYITIENLELTHDPTVTGSAVYVRDAITGLSGAVSHITLKDLYIHHIDSSGLNIWDVNTLLLKDCTIKYCGYSAIASPDKGLGGGVRNITIDGCNLSYNGHYYQGASTSPWDRPDGIGLEEGPGPIEVKNSLVEHNKGDGIDLKLSNCHVHHNIVANNFADGIKLWSGVTTVENNVVYGVGDGSATPATPWVCLVIDGATGETYVIQNNTFRCNPERGHYMSTIQYSGRSNINLTMRNNIFSNSASTVWLAPEITSYTIQNNLWDRASSSYEIEIGGAARTVEQLNVLLNCRGNTQEAPSFVSPAWGTTGNYRLNAGSAGIDQGTLSGAPSDDLDGVSRPVGSAVDIGAYER